MLSDINGRRALALALRAQEGRGGEMVSGRYVPNMRAIGGPLARGLFGDPLQQLQSEEQGALQSYGDELAKATQGLLGMNPSTTSDEFARLYAEGQAAGVDPGIMKRAMQRHQPIAQLDAILSRLDTTEPRSAPSPSGAPPGSPAPGARNGVAQVLAPQGGGTPLSNVPTARLLTAEAMLDPDDPGARLVKAELKARAITEGKDGTLYRGGEFIGKWIDGALVDASGNVVDVTGDMQARRAGARASAEASGRAPYTPIETGEGDARRTTFATQLPGYGATGAPPSGGARMRVNFEGTPDEIRSYVDRAIRENAAPTPASASGGYPLGTSMPATEMKRREAEIDTRAKSQQGINDDFMKSSYRPTIDAGSNASSTIAQLDALEKLALKTGWGSSVQASAARILNGLGLRLAPDAAKQYAAKAETFYAIVGQQNWQLLAEQKGPQTEGDAQRAAKVFSQLTNTEEANRFIRDLARANALVRIEKAKFYRENLPAAQKAGDLSRIDAAWAERQPSIFAFPFMRSWGQPGNAAAARASSGGRDPKLDEYLEKYGPPRTVKWSDLPDEPSPPATTPPRAPTPGLLDRFFR